MGHISGRMPWKEVTDMEEKLRFVSLLKTDRYTLTELCEQFGISRKTRYKYLERYEESGAKGLEPRSHRTKECPHRTDQDVERLIVSERQLHRTWGPKKLQKLLEVRHGIESPPEDRSNGVRLYRLPLCSVVIQNEGRAKRVRPWGLGLTKWEREATYGDGPDVAIGV